jgi:cell division protein ZapA
VSDAPKKQAVTVRIAGEEHTIRASADPEYTRECAEFVDDRIAEVRQVTGMVEGHKAAILAALSITDQFFQARSELDVLRRDVASRTADLAGRIQGSLAKLSGTAE